MRWCVQGLRGWGKTLGSVRHQSPCPVSMSQDKHYSRRAEARRMHSSRNTNGTKSKVQQILNGGCREVRYAERKVKMPSSWFKESMGFEGRKGGPCTGNCHLRSSRIQRSTGYQSRLESNPSHQASPGPREIPCALFSSPHERLLASLPQLGATNQ